MSNEKFLISVIVPTYNRSKGLEHTIRSLMDQDTDKSDFELVVADDGSSDDTLEVVKRYEGKMSVAYGYQPDRGYRPASARNMGIRLAKGRICLFIDSGIVLKRDCLRKHIEYHRKYDKEIAIVGYTYGYTQHGATEDELSSLIDFNDADRSIRLLRERNKFLDIRDKIYRKYNDRLHEMPSSWTLFWGGHLSVPVKTLNRVGGFDENFDGNWGCEDNDLGYRLLQNNVEICLCREAQVLHLPHGTNMESKAGEGYANCRYFHSKYRTPETSIFLSYYLKEITGSEVIDFNELFVKAAEPTTV